MNGRRITISPFVFFLLLILVLGLIGFLSWQAGYLDGLIDPAAQMSVSTNTAGPTQETVALPSPGPTETADTPEVVSPLLPVQTGTLPGLIVFSMTEAGFSHLFAYHPETLALTRLTYGDWDDRHPALAGAKIAFTSNRGSQWDIYLLDLTSGETVQITDDLAYDGHPAWSSDGLWLAYEKYLDDNLDVYVRAMAKGTAEVRVTTHPAPDFEPAWQPGSTLLAFTSARTGALDIFLADTGQTDSPRNYTNNITADQRAAVWSPDGATLAWTSSQNGYPTLIRAAQSQEAALAKAVTHASAAVWDPSGEYLLTLQRPPDGSYLAIQTADGRYSLLPTPFPGRIDEISWGPNMLPNPLPAPLAGSAAAQPSAPWLDRVIPSAGALYGRQNMIDLPDIIAPHPALSALAVEPFFALKDRASAELGWDVLSDLENLFVPISQPLPPGRANDWLYTGRAFALNPVLIDYEYMAVVREDFGPEVYWRVYLKPLDQSGALGAPLTDFPWDFDARFSGAPTAYESGGAPFDEIPSGYWVDFTTLALEYGWERQPALLNWQSYYQGARFNVFAITSGLDWEDAMLQIWPPEIFLSQGAP